MPAFTPYLLQKFLIYYAERILVCFYTDTTFFLLLKQDILK